jgi:hypothetical protein
MSSLDTSAVGRVDSVGVYNLGHSSQVHMQFFISNTNIDTTAFASFSRCFPTPCPTHRSAEKTSLAAVDNETQAAA